VLAELSPDVYAKGGDWPLAVLREKDLPEGFSGEVRRLRQIPGARTTLLVDRIRTNPASPRLRPTRGHDRRS